MFKKYAETMQIMIKTETLTFYLKNSINDNTVVKHVLFAMKLGTINTCKNSNVKKCKIHSNISSKTIPLKQHLLVPRGSFAKLKQTSITLK